MQGALTMVKEFIRESISEAGFMDLRADNVARMRTFVERGTAVEEEAQAALDPGTAAEVVAALGADLPHDMNAVLRIVARIDPKRVAALLR
jgi:hypothetical protein